MLRKLTTRMPNPHIISRDRLLHVDSGDAKHARNLALRFLDETSLEVRASSFPFAAPVAVAAVCVGLMRDFKIKFAS